MVKCDLEPGCMALRLSDDCKIWLHGQVCKIENRIAIVECLETKRIEKWDIDALRVSRTECDGSCQ